MDGGQDVGAVPGDGADTAADGVPVAGDLLGAEPARYLLLGLSRPQAALGLVRSGRYPQAGAEPQHAGLPVAQAFQQVAAGLLLPAGDAGDLGQAGQDAMPERVDQGRGDAGGDGGQALGAGGVRGMDEPLQGLAGLDGTGMDAQSRASSSDVTDADGHRAGTERLVFRLLTAHLLVIVRCPVASPGHLRWCVEAWRPDERLRA